MKYHYEIGTVRWLHHTGGDVRGRKTPKGWEAHADLLEKHPITGEDLKGVEWWIQEVYTGIRRRMPP